MIFLIFLLISNLTGISDRIELNTDYNIYNCLFQNLGGNVLNGGAITKTTNTLLILTECNFFNCSSKSKGGAIYSSNGINEFSKNCFKFCVIFPAINNNFGNAFHLIGKTTFSYSTAIKCGPEITKASDSTFYFQTGETISNFINCTECSGNGGASGLFYNAINLLSTINYLNIIGGYSNVGMCFLNTPNIKIDYINIINQQSQSSLWYLSNGFVNISNAFMFNNIYSSFKNNNNFFFINSFTNNNIILTGIIQTSFLTFNIIQNYDYCNFITKIQTNSLVFELKFLLFIKFLVL